MGTIRLLIVFITLSAFCAHAEIRIAVLEFQNNTGNAEMEHLKMGIRDMLTTDIQQVSAITVIERTRLNDVRKELDLGQSKYFDAQTAAQVGKLLNATHILTGAYLIDGQNMRIDVRLVNVSTGAIAYSEMVEGSTEDFFDLEKGLASAIVKNLYPAISVKEMRRVNQIQTEKFVVFEVYSKAAFEEEHGNIEEAVRLLQGVVEENHNFKLAKQKLTAFQQNLLSKIGKRLEENMQSQQALSEIMDKEFQKALAYSNIKSHSAEYYVAILVASVHYGLRDNHQKECEMLIQYWQEFSKEKAPFLIFKKIKTQLKKISLAWEKKLMHIETSDRNLLGNKEIILCTLTQEAALLFSYPKHINIWPFNACYGIEIMGKYDAMYSPGPLLTVRRNLSFDNMLPHTFFSGDSTISDNEDGLQHNSYHFFDPELSSQQTLEFSKSIAEFYIRNGNFQIEVLRNNFIRDQLENDLTNNHPFNPQTKMSMEYASDLLKSLHQISETEKDKNRKLAFDQYQLQLVKFIKGEAPGDSQATSFKIGKATFTGDYFILFVHLPTLMLFADPTFDEMLRDGILKLNPDSYFNLLTETKCFAEIPVNPTQENVDKALEFIDETVGHFIYEPGIEPKNAALRFSEFFDLIPENSHAQFVLLINDIDILNEEASELIKKYQDIPKQVSISAIICSEIDQNEANKIREHNPGTRNRLIDIISITNGKIYNESLFPF